MKHIDQGKINQRNKRILCLLVELNSTLELYYEPVNEKKIIAMDKKV